jgi:hypothetical protein
MSALPLQSPRPASEPRTRPHLEVAPTRAQRRARPRLLPAVITMAGIGAILLAQLLLSIVVADGAYTISDLQRDQRELQRQEVALTEQLEILSSTQNLTANAEHLGMIASGNPVFLDVTTGEVSGNPTPAGGALTGTSGNQIGNVLLTDTALVDAGTDTTVDAGGSPIVGGSTTTAPPAPGTIPSPTR